MERQDEERLIRQAAGGDSRAFRDLLEFHYDTIFRMAYRLSGHREDAEDITQMTCLKLAQTLPGFRGQSKFTTWLYTIVLNITRDLQRSRKSGAGLVSLDVVGAALLSSSAPSPEQETQEKERLRNVLALSEEEREAVILVFAEGLSHKEAADILGCAESTVSWRIHEARKKLADMEGGR